MRFQHNDASIILTENQIHCYSQVSEKKIEIQNFDYHPEYAVFAKMKLEYNPLTTGKKNC